MAQLLERLLCVREVMGSIPGQVIAKTFKMVLSALSLGAQHCESKTGRPGNRIRAECHGMFLGPFLVIILVDRYIEDIYSFAVITINIVIE